MESTKGEAGEAWCSTIRGMESKKEEEDGVSSKTIPGMESMKAVVALELRSHKEWSSALVGDELGTLEPMKASIRDSRALSSSA